MISTRNRHVRPPAGCARFERFADLFAPYRPDVLEHIRRAPGARWAELAGRVLVPPPPAAAIEPGKPGDFPAGAPVSTVYNRQEMTAELRTLGPRILTWDSDGHGTTCAGIAARSGRASGGKYAGVASTADLIAVRVGHGPGLENAWLLPAICDWIDGLAMDRPAVISRSFGGHRGGHHRRRRRALCVSAGNEARRRLHASVAIDPGDRVLLGWAALGQGAPSAGS
jgi:hypothetical protein